MLYNAKEDYHICPNCKVRVYHHDGKDDYLNDEIRNLMVDLRKTHAPREVLPAGPAAPHGGNKSKGRKRKHEMKKPTTQTLNQRLYTQT